MVKRSFQVMAFPAFSNQMSNPYNALLYAAITQADASIQVSEFSFKAALTKKVDIIHIHWPEVYAASRYILKAYIYTFMILFALFVSKMRGAKIVWTVHNLRPHKVKYPMLNKMLWPLFMKLVDGICSLSKANESIVLDTYPQLAPKRKVVTYHGLYNQADISTLTQSQARQHLELPDTGRVFLCLGQIKPYKGMEKLIRLFQLDEMQHHKLVIAGKALDTAYVNQLASIINDSSNIIFRPGFIANENLPHYFKAADWSVIAYDAIFNSGSALMSVTHKTPIILPYSDNFAEYGTLMPHQFLLYAQEINSTTITDALAQLQGYNPADSVAPKSDSPLSWHNIGQTTAEFYRQLADD